VPRLAEIGGVYCGDRAIEAQRTTIRRIEFYPAKAVF